MRFLLRERSDVELSCDQLLRIDRSIRGAGGRTAALLESGSHRLSLPRGVYSLRTRRGAALRVLHGGPGALPGGPGMEPWPEIRTRPIDLDAETTAPIAYRVTTPEEERAHESI